MIDRGGILMIEPSAQTSLEPVIDKLTRKMTAAWRRRRDSDYNTRGIHECACRVYSDNKDHWVTGNLMTNSLCIHYLAYHRKDVPPEELAKVGALPYKGEDPTHEELKAPQRGCASW